MTGGYFNIARDNLLPCFCQGCLVGKTEAQMSKRDIRYCVTCQPVIEEEYALQSAGSHKKRYIPSPYVEMLEGREGEVLLHTKSKESHTYQNPTEERPKASVGGRPKKDIPVDLIHKLSERGLSIGQIVKELKAQGQTVSAMTVSRVLSGERE